MSLVIILLSVLIIWVVAKHLYDSYRFPPGVNFINILHKLFCRFPFAKKSQSRTVIREKLCKTLLYEKCECKKLMKLSTGLPRLPLVGSLPFLNGEIGSRVMLSSVKLIPKHGDILGYFMGPHIK